MKRLNVLSVLLLLISLSVNATESEIKTLDEEVALLQTICPAQWETLDSQFDIETVEETDFWADEADYEAYKTHLTNLTAAQNLPEQELEHMSRDELTIISECMAQRVKVMLMLGGTPLGDAGVALLSETTDQAQNSDEEETIVIGSRVTYPAQSCLQIKDQHPDTETGYYWVKFGVNPEVFNVFCEMEHNGGGWMLWGYIGKSANPGDFFSNQYGEYDRFRKRLTDNNAFYSVYPLNEIADSEMIFALDLSEIHYAKIQNKYIRYRYDLESSFFNQGPNPCSAGAFEYSIDDINFYPASSACTANEWYPKTASGAYLSLIYTANTGVYWGTGMGGNNTWLHNAWIYVR